MITAVVIFAITYALIASEKVDKCVAALLGAGAVVCLHLAPFEELLRRVDLNVIFLLVGMMVVVNILALTGVFEWLTVAAAHAARGNILVVLAMLLLTTAFLSAWLDNVTTVILVVPVTIRIARMLEFPPAPVLILEAIFSNIGGTATLVGDPPNILIGSQVGLSFNEFLFHLAPVIVVVALVSVGLALLVHRRAVKPSPAIREQIAQARAEVRIAEPAMLRKALVILGLIIAGFLLGRTLGVPPGMVALAGAMVMALVCRVNVAQCFEKVEWTTIFFFVGLFMLVGALEVNGLFAYLAREMVVLTQGNLLFTALLVLWACAILSAIVDNIPLTMAMIPLLLTVVPDYAAAMGLTGQTEAIHRQITEPLFWSLALGVCLGGNGTLIGASANVVIAQIARRNGIEITFWSFTRTGLPYMLISLVICSLYIYLRYFAFI